MGHDPIIARLIEDITNKLIFTEHVLANPQSYYRVDTDKLKRRIRLLKAALIALTR